HAIADITLQQVLTRPRDFDVVATPNLNGDYLSDALAAQVGGIGIAPGGNINYQTGHAIFEATHGTAPKYANQDKVNPGSVILSGEMMLRHLGWDEAADAVIRGMEGAIAAKTVTYDFHRLMEGATLVRCSEFAERIEAIRFAAGLPAVGPEEPVMTEDDARVLSAFVAGEALFGREPVRRFTQVLGAALARIAEAAVSLSRVNLEDPIQQSHAGEL